MVSRVMAVIVSKRSPIKSSRLVSSAFQTLCKMSGEMDWFRLGGGEDVNEFIGVQLVVQQLCEVMSRGETVQTRSRLTLRYSCASMLSDLR